MKAIRIHGFGGPEVVSIGEVAPRAPRPDEVVVRVEAAGVNPLDLKILAGYLQPVFPIEFPYVPGADFAGVVDATGEQVAGLQAGDRVFGRTAPSAGGAFAQRLTIAAGELCKIPAHMSFEQAAALPSTFGTARLALFEVGGLQRGERVLIHAGAGGVGNMAVQQARLAGAHVIATASARNLELLASLGAHEAIDYRSPEFAQLRDVDLVLDTLGGETLAASWPMLRAGGRIASLVTFDIAPRDGHPASSVFFSTATPYLAEAVRQFEAGELQIVTDSIFPLDEARAALEKVATGHARGKVLIRTRS